MFSIKKYINYENNTFFYPLNNDLVLFNLSNIDSDIISGFIKIHKKIFNITLPKSNCGFDTNLEKFIFLKKVVSKKNFILSELDFIEGHNEMKAEDEVLFIVEKNNYFSMLIGILLKKNSYEVIFPIFNSDNNIEAFQFL